MLTFKFKFMKSPLRASDGRAERGVHADVETLIMDVVRKVVQEQQCVPQNQLPDDLLLGTFGIAQQTDTGSFERRRCCVLRFQLAGTRQLILFNAGEVESIWLAWTLVM